MYVKLSERELLLAFQAGIRLNDKFAKTFSKTLIAMQDHVAKKKGKFMSSHALAGLAVLSLRREDLIRSEYFIRIAKELFERGARDSRRRKEKDGLRGLWTKAVPGEVPH
ncbi:hypothetical protein Pmar_PMAR025713 [Perkinsus marinus ATCC 50983]|uniref:Uncharacterized protein n=1 Tax=Perkinsus marinus (strain ATCC 50983 / TXsc) TaxID=423536 RepID=C5LQK4_PERM5|nr:hypothetical protein Pmar_PMAR025713 [Perkinsus marinus ATCC 50983]EER00989.1 hypothetical protein Pmar_PMAR025713 [Perkinsus marinus ATCC 50983]|eukprot:XP_002768271.1 hypothetical protein Pmar_PMAR025713 [Perkinsus marinus ATCC 50983]